MVDYGREFAAVYNRRWAPFARRRAAALLAWLDARAAAGAPVPSRRVLDVCCGTGQLLAALLESGYTGTGIDLSPWMLAHARENCRAWCAQGAADFVEADAAAFSLPGRYGTAVSTFDALNHLPSLEALSSCFRCVRAALETGGLFTFDLNTRRGLSRWNGINVEDGEDYVQINRGVFDPGMDRAWTRITGFSRDGSGAWTRFGISASNTVFAMSDVQSSLASAGFTASWFVAGDDMTREVADPEAEDRAFVAALA